MHDAPKEVVSVDKDARPPPLVHDSRWTTIRQKQAPDLDYLHFEAGVLQMVHHPEHSSPWILRADILKENYGSTPNWDGWTRRSAIERRILPRSLTQRSIAQTCCIFESKDCRHAFALWTPIIDDDISSHGFPLFHPQVLGICFRWTDCFLSIALLPTKVPCDDRLRRVGVKLLDLLHKYATGSRDQYLQKMHHDLLVPRNTYQDTYLAMKKKYGYLISYWIENTDPQKHVWEDIGIATYLITLWRGMNRPQDEQFVDIGCGNGLLVFLLHCEGYAGHGFDLQERKSWTVWRNLCKERGLGPCRLVQRNFEPQDPILLPQRSFLIGNHADELTPWIPVLASIVQDCTGFLNIPCCPHKLNGRFTHQFYQPDFGALEARSRSSELVKACQDGMDRVTRAMSSGHSSKTGASKRPPASRYGAYLAYLFELTALLGWTPLVEALRIPSTKNWAIVGLCRAGESTGTKEDQRAEAQRFVERYSSSFAARDAGLS